MEKARMFLEALMYILAIGILMLKVFQLVQYIGKRNCLRKCEKDGHLYQQRSFTYVGYEPAKQIKFVCTRCGKTEWKENPKLNEKVIK